MKSRRSARQTDKTDVTHMLGEVVGAVTYVYEGGDA